MRAFRLFQLKRYFLDSTTHHHHHHRVRDSGTSLGTFRSRHFHSTKPLLRAEEDAGNNNVGGGSSNTSNGCNAFRDDSGTSGCRSPLVETMTSSVKGGENDDDVGEKKSGEVGSVGSRKSWTSSSSSSCGVDSGTRDAGTASADTVTSSVSEEDAGKNDGSSARKSRTRQRRRRPWLSQDQSDSELHRLSDVNGGRDRLKRRIPLPGTFGAEVARVLGGGLVPGSLVLISGDPGVGKSTLVLQIAGIIAEGSNSAEQSSVVYVSGEESLEQIRNRADHLGIGLEEIYFSSNTEIEDVIAKTRVRSPRALIIDSIQTVYTNKVTGSAGGIEVKECASYLLQFAKATNIPVFLIGHVTKSGKIAGPRVLEHIVDVVLFMEGEKSLPNRFLRSIKNRFGSTDELGMFEMSQSGLKAVDPSEICLSEPHSKSDVPIGLAVAVIMEDSRSILREIQAVVIPGLMDSFMINRVGLVRTRMILYVLTTQADLKIKGSAVFVNVVGGKSVKETAGDLAIAVAIFSSFWGYPIPRDVAFIGEIDLAGELRMVLGMEKRLNTVARLGYKQCIVPHAALKSLAHLDFGEMAISGCRNLEEVMQTVFRKKKSHGK